MTEIADSFFNHVDILVFQVFSHNNFDIFLASKISKSYRKPGKLQIFWTTGTVGNEFSSIYDQLM